VLVELLLLQQQLNGSRGINPGGVGGRREIVGVKYYISLSCTESMFESEVVTFEEK